MWYIEIDRDAIPYRFEMKLGGITWGFEVRYNSEFDFFTMDLFRGDETILVGEKIVYGQPLFEEEMKPVRIVPLDLSGNTDRVGWDELGETVFLYLEGGEFGELDTESAGAGGRNVD